VVACLACGYGVGVGQGGVHGFSPALTSFVGRAVPVGDVADLLARNRLVTVAGPGGVGKTRLAAEVARRVADRFADGVWLVELAGVRDAALVGAAVAEALRIPLAPGRLVAEALRIPLAAGRPVAEALAGVLARWQLLVVLDNCEHVLDAAAQLCGALLPAADDLRVLATSREPLGLAGEARYRLPPPGLPAAGPAGSDGWSEAVALFADRARQVVPGFALEGETGPLVAQIVTRLDGMPLAIELAAARVEALGVGQLLDRLDDRLALLVGADRTAAARQRSLAAAVDWSYQLPSAHAMSGRPGLASAAARSAAGARPARLWVLVPPAPRSAERGNRPPARTVPWCQNLASTGGIGPAASRKGHRNAHPAHHYPSPVPGHRGRYRCRHRRRRRRRHPPPGAAARHHAPPGPAARDDPPPGPAARHHPPPGPAAFTR
jgi:hypothetical protein